MLCNIEWTRMRTLMILAVFLGACCLPALSQWTASTDADLQKCMGEAAAKYIPQRDLSLTYEMFYYNDQQDLEPAERSIARIFRKGQSHRSEQLGILTIQDEKLRVSIDSAARVVLVSTPVAAFDPWSGAMGNDLMASAQKIGVQRSNGGQRFRLMFGTNDLYEAIEIAFDPQGWMLELVLLYRRHPQANALFSPEYRRPKVIMRFEQPKPLPVIAKHSFETGSVVDLSATMIQLRPNWSNYQLIDTRYK